MNTIISFADTLAEWDSKAWKWRSKDKMVQKFLNLFVPDEIWPVSLAFAEGGPGMLAVKLMRDMGIDVEVVHKDNRIVKEIPGEYDGMILASSRG